MSCSTELTQSPCTPDDIPPEFFDCDTLFPGQVKDEDQKPTEHEIQKWNTRSSIIVKTVGVLSKFWIKGKFFRLFIQRYIFPIKLSLVIQMLNN